MLLWVTFALLTAVALAALIWPLARSGKPPHDGGAQELAVYRDQLKELERDRARNLISASDAEAARNEVSRRLLAAEAARGAREASASSSARRAAMLTAALAVPVLAVSLYLAWGRPGLPGAPRAERLARAVEQNDYPAMIAQVEAHLAKNPRDAEGWLVLAPAYRSLGRYGEAAEAFGRALALVPPTAKLHSDLGEALVLANEGVVVARARKAFAEAVKLDAADMKSRFYLALADKQEGKHDAALAAWRAMLAEGPKEAPWRSAVERQIASLEQPAAPGPSEEQVAAAQNLSAEERETMIRGMVDGLASRLKENGKDLEGWLRLARARLVLGERNEAVAALTAAETHFKGDQASLARIADARKSLGLEGQ